MVSPSILGDLDILDGYKDIILDCIDDAMIVDEEGIKQFIGLLHSVFL